MESANPERLQICGILSTVSEPGSGDFAKLYARFQSPIQAINCGTKCSPYNERGVPFCCDPRHTVPTAYQAEWEYLEENSDLWRLWESESPRITAHLKAQAPESHVLIVCQGHERCQRGYRALSCRSFPFFPYLNSKREFIGLSYYWEYEERCWVISNLQVVSPQYRGEFIAAYDALFELMPAERESFRYQSSRMRRAFARRKRAIPLLHRNGHAYKITPRNERMRRTPYERMPKFGPYKIAAGLPFPDETPHQGQVVR